MPYQRRIEIDLEAFCTAAMRIPKMRRSPAGARGKVPKDTILTPCTEGLSVDTPAASTIVKSGRKWHNPVAVDALRLSKICKQYMDARVSSDVAWPIYLSVKSSGLVLSDGSLEVILPILKSR